MELASISTSVSNSPGIYIGMAIGIVIGAMEFIKWLGER